MDAYDRLRATLQLHAVAAANNAGVKIALPNEQVDPSSDGIFGEFWHKFTKAGPRPSLGGGRKHFKCRSGLLQFTLYAPEKTGDGAISRMGDSIEKYLSSQQYSVPPDGYVTLDDLAVDPINDVKKSGNYAVMVWTTFDFHYRDPDAVG